MPDSVHAGDSAYRMLFESAGDPICVHTEDKILAVNRKICELLGYTDEELLLMSPRSVNVTEQRVYMPEHMAKLKRHNLVSLETIFLKKDGTTVPVDVTARMIAWNGEPAAISICRDNTARKSYDNILLKAAFEWQHTFDAIKDAVFLLSPDHRILRCNKASYSIFNKAKQGEILGKFCWEVVHGTTEQSPMCPVTAMKKTQKRKTYVFYTGERWLEITVDPVLGEDNEITGLIHIASDITERKQVEDAFLEEDKKFRAIFNSTFQFIGLMTPDGRLIEANQTALSFIGLKLEDVVERPFWETHWWKGDEERVRKLKDSILSAAKGEFIRYEVELEGAGDTRRIFEFSIKPVFGNDGNVILLVPEGHDITERKMADAQKAALEEQNRHLQKVESLSRMAGAISHNFNNQLSIVMGYLDMVLGELPPDNSSAVKLKEAMNATHKASEVNRLLLAYLGQMPSKFEQLDLAELCRISLPILQVGIPKEVTMETDLSNPGPSICADAKQIQQLLTNLIINAWEAVGGELGTIHINVKTVSRRDIPSSHRFPVGWRPQEQQYACLQVRDSGCGIQECDMDKVFDPFFSTKFTGRGLGLSVVFGIVKAHDAAIRIESRINRGSLFSVFFPLSPQIAPARTEQPPEDQKIVFGDTVLLVEDNDSLLEMTRVFLVSLGFKVFQARDGVEAVELFEKNKHEISWLFCDLTMPRMGGWETISAIRAIRHDLPVVLTSGYDEDCVMTGKHAEMPDIFLPKPYNLNKLCNTIGHGVTPKTK